MTLETKDFALFFEALYGYAPFPWQERLLEHVFDAGSWPKVLALPTASGKTSVLDIALFTLAAHAHRPPAQRPARRIYFVVDRRLIVDEAWERALLIREKIISASHGILRLVGEKLLFLGGISPLEVVRLRGGIPREEMWDQNPLQPLICLSTVDQVGSRLLFRGYGVNEFSRSTHAGLLSHNSLLFLDEAHLSKAFEETLEGVQRLQEKRWQKHTLPSPLQVISMSATPKKTLETRDIFSLSEKDQENPLLAKRLNASKKTELLDASKIFSAWNLSEWAQIFTEKALTMLKELQERGIGNPVIGMVVNRVATARAIFNNLNQNPSWDNLLLTGRIRPLDREELLQKYLPRMRAGRSRGDNPRPLLVAATQTIEVGANLDFDGLISEAASLDALLQRFGREDRLGTKENSPGCILYHKNIHAKEDPVYGNAIHHTWEWLLKNASKTGSGRNALYTLDMGIQKIAQCPGREDPSLRPPHREAPLLLPAHLDLLVQTSPAPHPDPAVEVFLHGLHTEPAEVQIVWRGDLPEHLDAEDIEQLKTILGALPPMSEEALSLPLGTVKKWLEGEPAQPLGDCEGLPAEKEHKGSPKRERSVFLWRGMEESCVQKPKGISPGDTLVVPCTYGGIDPFGWNPSSRNVTDHSEKAWARRKKAPAFRCHPALIAQWLKPEYPEEALEELRKDLKKKMEIFPEEPLSEIAKNFLSALLENPWITEEIRTAASLFLEEKSRIVPYPPLGKPSCPGFMMFGNKALLFSGGEDDRASLSHPVSLASHCAGVAAKAGEFAAALGLPEELTEDVTLAGKLHDIGKSDPRFQRWLRNTMPLSSAPEEDVPLAKSGINRFDIAEIRASQKAAGYPRGGRHEIASVCFLQHHAGDLLSQAWDPALVIHLVGTHHGRGRVFMPVIDDPGEKIRLEWEGKTLKVSLPCGIERIDSGWSEQFWKLNKNYGWWGLAYLETILRLADHSESREEATR